MHKFSTLTRARLSFGRYHLGNLIFSTSSSSSSGSARALDQQRPGQTPTAAIVGVEPFLSRKSPSHLQSRGFVGSCVKMSNKLDPVDLFTDIGTSVEGVVALTTGAPGPDRLQTVAGLLEKASQHTLKNARVQSHSLQYGPRQGSPRFRTELAKFLSHGYGDNVNSEELLLTAGATYGLHLVGSVLFNTGVTVFVEDPTYFIAINILKGDLGCNVVAVPTDADGVDCGALDQLLGEHKPRSSMTVDDKHPFWSMVYLIPTYNNPRGMCFPAEKNRQLIEIARKHDVLLFCDDVYNLLHFNPDTNAQPRLVSYDKKSDNNFKGHVLSNGSFAKILAPGLRMGWIEAPSRILELLWKSNINWSAGGANHFASEVVASCLELGLQQDYLKQLNKEYAKTVKSVNEIFEENLPRGVSYSKPEGGYFYWIEMPHYCKSAEVAKIAFEEHSVRILPGQMCSPTGAFENCLRVSFSHYPDDILLPAVKKVCQAISKHMNAKSSAI